MLGIIIDGWEESDGDGMVDLHNHILPNVDDGARDLEEAFAMARQAVAVGTRVMAATPHRYRGREQSSPEYVEPRVRRLQEELDRMGIALRLVPGVEIPITPDILDDLRAGDVSPLGGASGRAVLMEPPFSNLPGTLVPALQALVLAGYQPILAHPERNSEVQRAYVKKHNLAFLEACAGMGCVIQLTSGSVIGHFGESALAVSRAVAGHADWKIILASDSHDEYQRTPEFLRAAADQVAEWIGDAARADVMVEDLPASLLPDR